MIFKGDIMHFKQGDKRKKIAQKLGILNSIGGFEVPQNFQTMNDYTEWFENKYITPNTFLKSN